MPIENLIGYLEFLRQDPEERDLTKSPPATPKINGAAPFSETPAENLPPSSPVAIRNSQSMSSVAADVVAYTGDVRTTPLRIERPS